MGGIESWSIDVLFAKRSWSVLAPTCVRIVTGRALIICYEKTHMRMISMDTKLNNLKGRRIRLLHTDNPHNKMRYGTLGTIIGVHHESNDNDEIAVLVKLDNGPRVTLFTAGDLFAFVD